MRPVFVGNFDFDTRQSDLERLFSRYGRVDRADMKNGATHGNRALYHGLPFQPKPSMPLPPASTPPSIHKWHSAFPSHDYSLLIPCTALSCPSQAWPPLRNQITCHINVCCMNGEA